MRDSVLSVKLSDEERQEFQELADVSGISVSTWVRQTCKEFARAERARIKATEDDTASVTATDRDAS